MKKLLVLLFITFLSCTTNEIPTSTNTVKKEMLKDNSNTNESVNLGWKDNDTYTVKATGENLTKAKQKARFQILKDIVSIRMKSQGIYTDISKISHEFEEPFEKAVILKQSIIPDGIEIYYQITEPGLKLKFEKK